MFNNKILVAVTALGILAGSNAFASRAHEVVMGTGDGGTILNGGSFFFDDNRNMFYNPAYINDFKNWATIEKSNAPRGTAEAGFVTSFTNFNLGVYFNRGDAFVGFPGLASNQGGGGSTPGTTYLPDASGSYTSGSGAGNPLRPIELLVGGDMGVKWGLGLTYASSSSNAGTNGKAGTSAPATPGNKGYFGAQIGASIANLEPFFGMNFIGRNLDKDLNSHYYRGGVRYHWGEWTPYAAVLSTNYNDERVAGTLNKLTGTNWGLGLGRSAKIAEGVRMNYALSYWNVHEKNETNGGTGTPTVETKWNRSIVPVDMAIEGDLASWITLRGGFAFRIWDSVGGTAAQDVADTTTARLGAGLHFGKADIDFAFGMGQSATEGAQADSQTLGVSENLFTAASLTYHW